MSGSQEEVVKEFVRELQSMMDTRPPISKAKMISITKSALKGIKFYKHIVMNVEKFITKCKPEYKIPGLYVIDSVIRQSRHQHGIDRDVYGSRFAKNIIATLHAIEKCPPEDKDKIIRVLNLWEKNAIFPSDVIKQLFQAHQIYGTTNEIPDKSLEKQSNEKSSGGADMNRFRELQESLKRASGKDESETTSILTEIQQITSQLLESQKKPSTTNNSGDEPSSTTASNFNSLEPMQSNVANVLDDFDYGSDNDDDEPRAQPMTNTSANFPLKNIQQSTIQYLQPPPGLLMNPIHTNTVSFPMTDANNIPMTMSFDPSHPPPILFQQPLPSSLTVPPSIQQHYNDHHRMLHQPTDVDLRPEDMESDDHHLSSSPPRHRYNRRRSRSSSPPYDSKRARSSSNSNNRRDSATSRLKEVEKRERRRKGLPPLKEEHLVVSSRTLWIGHLSKMITEADLREELGPYGEISDINHIPPRGCAFVCFKERSDASRCLEKMKDVRLHGSYIKVGWATNKGLKDRFKDYWDADHGCTYLPYSEINHIGSLNALAEGGTIDEESMPAFLKPTQVEIPPTAQPQPVQSFMHPPTAFTPQEFQPPTNLPPSAGNMHLESTNRLVSTPTILMAPTHQSPIRVGLPVPMMPPGAQIIQVQQHPHGQPVQVVQRIAGPVFPNSQIVHQMPYGHVIATGQPPGTIQIQHHPADLKELNAQALAAGGGLHLLTNATALPTHHHHQHFLATASATTGAPLTTSTFAHTLEGPALIQFRDNSQRRPSPSHFEDPQRHLLSSTDEQLLRLSTTSSAHFQPHMSSLPSALVGGSTSPTRLHHVLPPAQHHQFGTSMIQGQPSRSLLPTPTGGNELQKASSGPRRPSRFEDRDDLPAPPDANPNFPGFRGGRGGFNDRPYPSGIPRTSIRGRGVVGNNPGRGHYNSTNRPESADNNNNGGFRTRGGFNRGGRGGGNGNDSSRFYPRGHNRANGHEHFSSRSPDQSYSHRREHDPTRYSSTSDESSHRSLPTEALRKNEKSTFDPSSSNESSHN